jgi:hypothetical protein
MRRKIQVWLLLLWFTGFEGAQVRDSWKRQERERIIKLLEEADSACSDWAIALIKGETNE